MVPTLQVLALFKERDRLLQKYLQCNLGALGDREGALFQPDPKEGPHGCASEGGIEVETQNLRNEKSRTSPRIHRREPVLLLSQLARCRDDTPGRCVFLDTVLTSEPELRSSQLILFVLPKSRSTSVSMALFSVVTPTKSCRPRVSLVTAKRTTNLTRGFHFCSQFKEENQRYSYRKITFTPSYTVWCP